MRQTVWIDLTAVLGKQRGGAREGKAFPNRRRIEELQLNSHLPAQLDFRPQFRNLPLMTGQKQTGLPLEAAIDLQARCQPLQFANRLATQLVAPGRGGRADFLDQLAQRNINFVLEQRGARARTAGSDVALVDKQRLHAGFRQMHRHQRPGDPATDDDRVAGCIALQ